jgi:hypothetical protein
MQNQRFAPEKKAVCPKNEGRTGTVVTPWKLQKLAYCSRQSTALAADT